MVVAEVEVVVVVVVVGDGGGRSRVCQKSLDRQEDTEDMYRTTRRKTRKR